MITHINGNIFDSKADIICHQVNCQGVMGAGLALEIKKRYPEVFKEYKWLLDNFGSQLGHCQLALCLDGRTIANLFGQDGVGTHKQQTDYHYLAQAFKQLRETAYAQTRSIAIPYGIGCGLGGGSWAEVLKIITSTFEGYQGVVEIWRFNQ